MPPKGQGLLLFRCLTPRNDAQLWGAGGGALQRGYTTSDSGVLGSCRPKPVPQGSGP